MTALMNFSGLCRNIKKLINANMQFSLVLIDIDNFGIFNKHSYKLGDEVLKEFSTILKQSFPNNALIARFRIGDEFIIAFKNTNLKNAKRNIDALKEKCKNYYFTSLADFSIHTLTFSEGIVELNSENNNIDALLLEAEKLLKENKKQKI